MKHDTLELINRVNLSVNFIPVSFNDNGYLFIKDNKEYKVRIVGTRKEGILYTLSKIFDSLYSELNINSINSIEILFPAFYENIRYQDYHYLRYGIRINNE